MILMIMFPFLCGLFFAPVRTLFGAVFFPSLNTAASDSFVRRFRHDRNSLYFRGLWTKSAYLVSESEARTFISSYERLVERTSRLRRKLLLMTFPSLLMAAVITLPFRHASFYSVVYTTLFAALLFGLPMTACGQFWYRTAAFQRSITAQLANRYSIEIGTAEFHRTTNQWQLLLRWTAIAAIGAIVAIRLILPDINPELSRKLRPLAEFDVRNLVFALLILYALSRLWDFRHKNVLQPRSTPEPPASLRRQFGRKRD